MRHANLVTAVCAMLAAPLDASITTFLDQKASWLSAAGPTTFLDFIPANGQQQVVPNDTYAGLGLTLDSAPAGFQLSLSSLSEFQDGWGLVVQNAFSPNFSFAQPIDAFALDMFKSPTGFVTCLFYSGGVIVGTSTITVPINSFAGYHHFGWTTDFQFDQVTVAMFGVDNIYFPTIPAPPVVAILALTGLGLRRRRR